MVNFLISDIINDVNGGNDNNYVVVQNSLNRVSSKF